MADLRSVGFVNAKRVQTTGLPPRRRGFRSVTLLHAGFCFRYATTLVAPSSDRKNWLFYRDTSHVNAQMKYLSVTL